MPVATRASLTLPTATLRGAIETAERSVKQNSPIVILQQLLLDAGGGTLKVTGSNGASWTEVAIPCEGELRCCVNAAKFKAAVSLAGDSLSLEYDGKNLTGKSGNYKFTLGTVDPDDFPHLPDVEGETITLDCALLKEAIQSVRHSCGDDKRGTDGLHFKQNGDFVEVAAFRSHTFAMMRVAGVIENETTWPPEICDAILKMDGEYEVNQSARLISVSGGQTTIVSSPVLAPFAPYERGLAKEQRVRMAGNKSALIGAVKRAMIATTNYPRIELAYNGGLVISASDPSGVASMDTVDVSAEGAAGFSIAINGQYLLDALGPCGAESIIEGTDVRGHLTVRDPFREGWVALIMPLMPK